MATNALEKFAESVRQARSQQPSLGAELKSMTREAVKDVRGTLHETFFGKSEHFPETGTPLNPTPQIITADLRGKKLELDMDR